MTDDVLTFEELRNVQNSERQSDTLQNLDGDFFERARNYLETKKGGEDHLQNQEYRNAKNILQDILDMRQKKIVKLAFLSVKSNVNVENLLGHEEELFQEVEEAIGAYRHDRNEEVFEKPPTDPVETVEDTAETVQEEAVEDEETGEEPEEEVEIEMQEEENVEREDEEGDGETDREPGETEEEEAGEEGTGDEEESGEEDSGSSVDDILEFEGGGDAEEDGEEEVELEVEEEDASHVEGEEDGDEDGEGDRVSVRVQERVPEFMGTDLNAYGPFEEGEEVELPAENADVLEQQGKAERV